MKNDIMKAIAISLVFTLITQSAYPFSADKANLAFKNTLSPKHQGVSLKVLPSLIRLWYLLKDISLSRPSTAAELGENLPYISSLLPGNTEIYSKGGILLLKIYTGGKDISYLAISPSKVTEREIRDFSGDTGAQRNSIEKVFSTDEFSIYAWGCPYLSRDKLDYVSILHVFLETLSQSSPDEKRIIGNIAIRIFRQFFGRNASRLNSVFACFSDGIVFSDKKGRPLQLVYIRDNELKGVDLSWIPDISEIMDEGERYKIKTAAGDIYYAEKSTGIQYRDTKNKHTELKERNILKIIIIGSLIIPIWFAAQGIIFSILAGDFHLLSLILSIISVIPLVFLTNLLLSDLVPILETRRNLVMHTSSITNIPVYQGPVENLPPVTVMIPVYKEPFGVIRVSIQDALDAVRYYNEKSGQAQANVVVCDDGLMVISSNNLEEFERRARDKPVWQRTKEEEEVINRLDFYRANNITFIARPKEVKDDPDTKREGTFKKASNLNFTLRLDIKIRNLCRGMSYEEALGEIKKVDRRYRLAYIEGNVCIGEYVVSLDKDSRMPKEAILLTIPEFINDSRLAFTMHQTAGYEFGGQTYFGRLISYFTHLLYDVAIPYRIRTGAPTPYMGHNGIIRRAALESIGLWNEDQATEDLFFSMGVWKNGQYGKYIMYHGFKWGEAITDNFSDESSKYHRYVYGLLQIILNPPSIWLKEGIFRKDFKEYLKSKEIKIWPKLDLFIYASSFINLALIIPACIWMVIYLPSRMDIYLVTILFIFLTTLEMIVFHRFNESDARFRKDNIFKQIAADSLYGCSVGLLFLGTGLKVLNGFKDFFFNKKPNFGATNIGTKEHSSLGEILSVIKMDAVMSLVFFIIAFGLGVYLYTLDVPLIRLFIQIPLWCIILLPFLFNPSFMEELIGYLRKNSGSIRKGAILAVIIGLLVCLLDIGIGWVDKQIGKHEDDKVDRPIRELVYKKYKERVKTHNKERGDSSGLVNQGELDLTGGQKRKNSLSKNEQYFSTTGWSPIDSFGGFKTLEIRMNEMWDFFNNDNCGDAMIVANNIIREFSNMGMEQNNNKGVHYSYEAGDEDTRNTINSFYALNAVAGGHFVAANCAVELNLPAAAAWHINRLRDYYYNAQVYNPEGDFFWSPIDVTGEIEGNVEELLKNASTDKSSPSLLDSQLSDDELIEKYWEKIVDAFGGDEEKAKEYVGKFKKLPPEEKKKVKKYIVGLGLLEKSLFWTIFIEMLFCGLFYFSFFMSPYLFIFPLLILVPNTIQLIYFIFGREKAYPIITDFLKFAVPVKEGLSSTDRRRIYFNPAYMSRLPVGIQKAIFFHERLHKGMAILKTPYLNIVRNAIEEFILHLLDNIYLAYYFFSRIASVRDKIAPSTLDDLSEELRFLNHERDLLKRLMLDKRIKYDAIVNRLLKKDDLECVIKRLRWALRLVESRIPNLGIEDKLKLVYSIVYIDYEDTEEIPLEIEYSERYAPDTLDEFICWLRNILESRKLPDYIAGGILDVFLRKDIYKCTNETFNGFIDKLGCLLNRDIKRFKPIKEIRRNLKPQDEGRMDVYRITKRIELFLDGLKTVGELSFEGSVNIVQSPETGKLGLILRRKDGEVKAIELNAEPLDSKIIDVLSVRALEKIKDIEDLVLRGIAIGAMGYLEGKTFYAIEDNPYIVGVANNKIVCINKVFLEGVYSIWGIALFRIAIRLYLNNNPDKLPIGSGVDEIADRLQAAFWNKLYKDEIDPITMRLRPEGYVRDDVWDVWVFSNIHCTLDQGWKIHIAARKEDALEVLELVLPIIKKYKLPHKVCRLNEMDSLKGTQAGKFICVYIDRPPGEFPAPEDVGREMALEIDRALQGRGFKPPDGMLWNGAGNQGDKLIKGGKSGLVGYRYGAFRGYRVEVNGQITKDKRDRYKPEGIDKTLCSGAGAGENAFLVGEGNEEFPTEVKGAIRDAYKNPGAIRQYRWDNGRVIVETNRGGEGEAEFSPVILSDYEKELFEYMFNNVIDKGIKLVFVEGLNLINYKSLSLHQIARASSTREQLYFPMNILYLIHLSADAEGALRHIIKHEEYHKREPLASEEDARRAVEKEGNKEAFLELLQLAGAVEEIAQRIVKHVGRDLMLYLDMEGKLRIKGTDRDVEIFDIDSESIVVSDKELRLNYWDVLRSRLKGRKDTILEIIPKGLELTDIRKLLLHVLLRRELISQDEALTKGNLVNLEGIAARIQNRMKIYISSKHLIDNVVKKGENRFAYNQNSSGIKYLLDRIGSGFHVEIINESGVSDSELQTLVSLIFGLGQNFSTKNVAVINQQDATALDYRDSILLLHGDSAGALKSLKDKGVKVLIGEKGVSINVLVTVGIYKLLGKTEDEMEKLLLGLGYTEKQISEMDLKDLINLPPIPSLLPLINDMASIRRVIDISA